MAATRQFSTFSAILLCAALIAAFALPACTASETTLQGGMGEYCNGFDDDCRAPLVCENYICVCQDCYWDECTEICNRLDSCDTPLDNCHGSCLNTTQQWGEDQLDQFRTCFVDDLSCADLQASDDPPQTCYRELPLPDERAERCSDFVDEARRCGAPTDAIDGLSDDCRVMARTRGDDVWAYSDECVERIDDGVCRDILDCLDETFQLDPPLASTNSSNDISPANDDDMNDEFNVAE